MKGDFHYNKHTGKVSRCRAIKKCPFGDLIKDHYSTKEEAAKAYEAEMKRREIATPVSRENLKLLNSNQLSSLLLTLSKETELSEDEVDGALELSSLLHAKQRRRSRVGIPNTPYIEHPLRTSIRLMRWGVTDASVLKAALLHDTVEDCSEVFLISLKGESDRKNELEAREELLHHIEVEFGKETRELVNSVTNEIASKEEDKSISQERKREKYREHLDKEISSSPKVMLVKLSDFIDNAGSLSVEEAKSKDVEKVRNSALKYLPCVQLFIRELPKAKNVLPQSFHDEVKNKLLSIENRLKVMVD